MTSLKTLTHHTYVINLKRRSDRRIAFAEQWSELFAPAGIDYEIAFGLDGMKISAPAWWSAGSAAWCCARAHIALWERAVSNDCDWITIFEDDCVFAGDAPARMRRAAEQIPGPGMVYWGGQLTKQPRRLAPVRVAPDLVECTSVNRLHAYSLHVSVMRILLDQVWNERNWGQYHRPKGHGTRDHIDHAVERASESGAYKTWCVQPWTCYQGEGYSDIGTQMHPTRKWEITL